MSFLEIIVVILVSITVLDMKDVRFLFRKFLHIKKQVKNFKQYIVQFLQEDDKMIQHKTAVINKVTKINKMNSMIKKIIKMEGQYKGNYSFKEVKSYYNKIINKNSTNYE